MAARWRLENVPLPSASPIRGEFLIAGESVTFTDELDMVADTEFTFS